MSDVTSRRDDFEALFHEHYADVMRYAARRVGEDAAQEVVADTFLVAWRRLEEIPARSLPWLYATARRVVANEHRRASRAQRLASRIQAEPAPAAAVPLDGSVTDRLWVRDALAQLSARDREVLMLAEWEQLDPADAAAVVGCSVSAYHVRLHRARKRIARLLGREHEPPRVTRFLEPDPDTEGICR